MKCKGSITTETQCGIAATKAFFPSRVPLPASSCGERETRSAGEGRFPRLDLPSAAPSSAFGTFSPAKKPRGRRTLDVTKAREPSKKNLCGPRRIDGLVVQTLLVVAQTLLSVLRR